MVRAERTIYIESKFKSNTQADPVWVNSAAENEFLGLLHEDTEDWFWIGAKKYEDGLSSFLWTDGTPLNYENWNRINGDESGGDCAISGLGLLAGILHLREIPRLLPEMGISHSTLPAALTQHDSQGSKY